MLNKSELAEAEKLVSNIPELRRQLTKARDSGHSALGSIGAVNVKKSVVEAAIQVLEKYYQESAEIKKREREIQNEAYIAICGRPSNYQTVYSAHREDGTVHDLFVFAAHPSDGFYEAHDSTADKDVQFNDCSLGICIFYDRSSAADALAALGVIDKDSEEV